MENGTRAGSADLDQPAVFEAQDPVHFTGKLDIMRCDEDGQALFRNQAGQLTIDLLGGMGIEVAGRFVGQQQARAVGDGAGDRDTLLLAAREFAGADA